MALTDKQDMFSRECLIDLKATQADIRAVYSGKTATVPHLKSSLELPS